MRPIRAGRACSHPEQYAASVPAAMPHVTLPPVEISLNTTPATSVGTDRLIVVPSPIPAQPFEPQQYATPAAVRPQLIQLCVLMREK